MNNIMQILKNVAIISVDGLDDNDTTYLMMITPNGHVRFIQFDKKQSYEQLSKAVGGYIELLRNKTLPLNIDLYGNEEAKLLDLPINPVLTEFYCRSNGWFDTIHGIGVFAKHDENGDTLGLTKKECHYIIKSVFDIIV